MSTYASEKAPAEPALPPAWAHTAMRVWREETAGLRPELCFANLFPRLLPVGVGNRVRAALYRMAGISVGRGTVIHGALSLSAYPGKIKNLRIGDGCFINSGVFADANGPITIGSRVSIGHHVVLVTTSHDIGGPGRRAGKLDIRGIEIGDGCWIGAGSMLLPGIKIGAGSIVAAGSIVNRDVPENTLVGGVPARVIRDLSLG